MKRLRVPPLGAAQVRPPYEQGVGGNTVLNPGWTWLGMSDVQKNRSFNHLGVRCCRAFGEAWIPLLLAVVGPLQRFWPIEGIELRESEQGRKCREERNQSKNGTLRRHMWNFFHRQFISSNCLSLGMDILSMSATQMPKLLNKYYLVLYSQWIAPISHNHKINSGIFPHYIILLAYDYTSSLLTHGAMVYFHTLDIQYMHYRISKSPCLSQTQTPFLDFKQCRFTAPAIVWSMFMSVDCSRYSLFEGKLVAGSSACSWIYSQSASHRLTLFTTCSRGTFLWKQAEQDKRLQCG